MSAWEISDTPTENQVLQGDGFFISYMSGENSSVLDWCGSDWQQDETALVVSRGKPDDEPKIGTHNYFILNGDHRKEYESLVPGGLDACKKYYEQHQNEASSWSDR